MYYYWPILLFSFIQCKSIINVKPSSSSNATERGSLQYYLCGNGSESLVPGTVLSLASFNQHTLLSGSFCLLTRLTNLTVASDNPSQPAHIICDNVSRITRGLGFRDMVGLTLKRLHLHHCSGQLTSAALRGINQSKIYFPPDVSAGILIVGSTDVILNHVTITGDYCGYGVIISASYNVYVHTVSILHNTDKMGLCNKNKSHKTCFNSGLLLLYSSGYSNFSLAPNTSLVSISNLVIHCHINLRRFVDVERFLQSTHDKIAIPLISAGGLTLHLMDAGYLQHLSKIVFSGMNVQRNEGGGMLLLYVLSRHVLRPPPVYIVNSIYSHNTVYGNGAGLAVYLIAGEFSQVNQSSLQCIVCFLNSSMFGQTAYGSAAGLYLSIGYNNTALVPPVLLDRFYIINNFAREGASAIYAQVFHLRITSSKVPEQIDFTLTLKNANLFDNADIHNGSGKRNHFSKIATTKFVNLKLVIVDGPSIFDHNFGSAILMCFTSLHITGHVMFLRNRGLKGGAITLKSNSLLTLHDSAMVNFTENKAYTYGGAIYSDSSYCPIQFISEHGGLLTFIENRAYLEGDDIFFKGPQNCSDLYSHISYITPEHNQRHHSISSPPIGLYFCTPNETKPYYDYGNLFPGGQVQFSLFAKDKGGNKIYSPISITFAVSNTSLDLARHWLFLPGQNIQMLCGGHCTSIHLTVLQQFKPPVPTGYIELAVLGKLPSLNVRFTMQECPLGFEMRNKKCECDRFLVDNNISKYCNINTLGIYIKHGSWLGVVHVNNDTETLDRPISYNSPTNVLGYTHICPTGYCTKGATEIDISKSSSYCQGHRTGVFCGGCDERYSVAWGTVKCVQCPHYSIVSIIAIPAFSLLVVLMLFLTRLNISNGCLGAVIFYANVHAASLRYESVEKVYVKVLFFFLACLNDTVDFPVCLSSHFTAVTKTGSFFIFPVFLLSIVLGLVIASRYSTRISNFVAHSSIQVVATLFYLSFAKLLLTAIDILTPVSIHTPAGNFLVWYVDGNIPFWRDTGHVVLTIIAFVTIAFLLFPFLLFTTFGSLLFHCRYLRPYSMYIRPFVDAYQGPYRQPFKFWFGLRLWLLLYIYICFAALRGLEPSLMILSQMIPLLLFTLIQAYVKPYRKTSTNIVDLFVLFNICLTYLIKIYFYCYHKEDESHSTPYLSFLTLLVMLLFCGLVLQHLLKALRRTCKQVPAANRHQTNIEDYEEIPENSDNQLREPLLSN